MKKICYFGIYDPAFIRNAVLMQGFRKNGYEVVECRVDPAAGPLKKFWRLYTMGRELKRQYTFEHVLVGFPGHSVMWLARLLFGTRVVFDAFLSLYDARVNDRKAQGPLHPLAWRDWFYDWLSCTLAWKVLLPENVHIEYFSRTFGLPREKFIRVFTGANDEVFHSLSDVSKAAIFTVHFHGTFIPLQGIEYIIEAARLLKDEGVHFRIIGSGGRLFEHIVDTVARQGLGNVIFEGRKPLEKIPRYIAEAHVCLGVFGSTPKTQRVISNKIYECIACAAPVITSRTPAVQELFTDRENILLANAADGKDLAEKILEFKNTPALADQVAHGGYELFRKMLTPQKLVAGLVQGLYTP